VRDWISTLGVHTLFALTDVLMHTLLCVCYYFLNPSSRPFTIGGAGGRAALRRYAADADEFEDDAR